MSPFTRPVTAFWTAQFTGGDVLFSEKDFVLAVNPDLREERRLMMLETAAGRVLAVVTPALASALHLPAGNLTELTFRRALNEAGVKLHGADLVFYFTEADGDRMLHDAQDRSVRPLTEADRPAFAAFQAAAPAQDVDDAYVELDHWAVFGAFDHGRLACAASAYPWEGAQIADIGVLTAPDCRRRGHARNVVRSISRYAREQGYEPQYRCQFDNHASAAVARSAGLTLFGKWEVISSGSGV